VCLLTKLEFFTVRFWVRTCLNLNRTTRTCSLGSGLGFSKISEPNLGLGSGFTKTAKEPDQTGPRQPYMPSTMKAWAADVRRAAPAHPPFVAAFAPSTLGTSKQPKAPAHPPSTFAPSALGTSTQAMAIAPSASIAARAPSHNKRTSSGHRLEFTFESHHLSQPKLINTSSTASPRVCTCKVYSG
jgi:hypothetical protein